MQKKWHTRFMFEISSENLLLCKRVYIALLAGQARERVNKSMPAV